MSLEEISRKRVDPKNSHSLFSLVVGQEEALGAISDLCYKGLVSGKVQESIVLCGPPSTGKTMIVKLVAQLLGLPKVLVDGSQLTNVQAMVDAILQANSELEPYEIGEGVFMVDLPPTLIFVDEIHALTRKVQDGLLKATERSDGMLMSKSYVVDCRNVFWVGATTDWGKLCPAFRTRLRRINLYAPTHAQMVKMIENRVPAGLASEVVKFGGMVPRECFAFIRAVKDCADRTGKKFAAAMKEVAERDGIDEYGMRSQSLKILRAIEGAGENGSLLRDLVSATNLQKEELLGYWLPPLMTGGLIVNDGRYMLTEKGEDELEKRS
jgi:Holliday junction resolvasome RuvABC ATP-dependent DNA helicase subunit